MTEGSCSKSVGLSPLEEATETITTAAGPVQRSYVPTLPEMRVTLKEPGKLRQVRMRPTRQEAIPQATIPALSDTEEATNVNVQQVEQQVSQSGGAGYFVPTVAQAQRFFTPTQMRVTPRWGNPHQMERPTQREASPFQQAVIPVFSDTEEATKVNVQKVEQKVFQPGGAGYFVPTVAQAQRFFTPTQMRATPRWGNPHQLERPTQREASAFQQAVIPAAPAVPPMQPRPSAPPGLGPVKQMLGERLFPLVQSMCPDLAGKITGMLLEMDNSDLLHALQSMESLRAKVEEAVVVIQAHRAKAAPAVPPMQPRPSAPSGLGAVKQRLGERLSPLVQSMCPDLAGKITGMFLELDNSDLLHLLQSMESLRAKVEEAVVVIQAHRAKEQTE